MAVFAYQALDLDESPVRGTLVADTARAARDLLRAKGLTVESIDAVGTTTGRAGALALLDRYHARQCAAQTVGFVREISTLLAVGIPLLEGIDTIASQHRGAFARSLLLLRDRVSEGLSLADAMRQQPLVYDELTISMTEVGENAGNLDDVLGQLADFKERSAQFRNRVMSALLYPCIVLFFGLGVGLFLMTFVVPKLLQTLVEAGRPLPWATAIVKSASDGLLHHGWMGLVVLAALFALGAVLRRQPGAQMALHRFQLKIPILGELIRKQEIARAALVMATLTRSGIVFVNAVRIARRSVRNLVIRQALELTESAVEGGREIAQGLEQTGVFPRAVVQVFALGQQSGRLEEMLERLASDYDRQVASATTRLSAVLEPVLIIALAAFIGLIALATVMPILEAGNAM